MGGIFPKWGDNTVREIKFRAWVNKDHMLNWNAIQNQMYFCDIDSPHAVFMQFTGLRDKNGKEIYEGDIVAIRYAKSQEIFKQDVVRYGIYDIGCNGYEYSFEVIGPYVKDECLYSAMVFGDAEVIGNIYEHPHLLEEGAIR